MVRSIRWRLQIWYALVLLAVVSGFAGLLYYRVRTARLQEIDTHLEVGLRYLEASLRPVPPWAVEGLQPPPDGPFRERGKGRPDGPPFGRPGGPPPGPGREGWFGELQLPPSMRPRPEEEVEDRPYFVIWRRDGTILKTNAETPPQAPVIPPEPRSGPPTMRVFQRGDFREVALPGVRGTLLLVGKPIVRERSELWRFAWQLAGSGGLVLVVGLLGGWLVSARVLRPIRAIATTAAAISATNLSNRIDTHQIDTELIDLAEVLNATFARLEGAFERQARFTADASHELRTPLAVLQSSAELALARPRSPEEYRQTLQASLRAAARMRSLVDGLLMLARTDAGRLDLEIKPVELSVLVEEVAAQHADAAAQAGVRLTVELPPTPVLVAGDAGFLARVPANLLSNALRHTPAGGEVRVTVTIEGNDTVLRVTDTGSGIPAEDQPRIFERFYRVDKARSRASGGSGLGLAICRGLVEAHGGTIGFTSHEGKGSTFFVRLPQKSGPLSPPSPARGRLQHGPMG